MPAELVTQARLPISDLEEQVRKRYGLKQKLVDFRIEGDSLVLFFAHEGDHESEKTQASAHSPSGSLSAPVRRRRKGKRNRMKTRGWDVVAKIGIANGQTATIYQPFVDALSAPNLSPAQQRTFVSKILRSNGNSPESGSVEYFLNNTLTYLANRGK